MQKHQEVLLLDLKGQQEMMVLMELTELQVHKGQQVTMVQLELTEQLVLLAHKD
jgi:hypothetical protein